MTLAGKIVQDADQIDALGAIGILGILWWTSRSPLYDPKIARKFKSKQDYRQKGTVINHFYEKLFKLPATMNTKAAKAEAQRRMQFMEEFLAEFYDEWNLS